MEQGSDLSLESKFRVTAYSVGIMQWLPGFKFSTDCDIDLTFFPFDEQTCYLQVTQWSFNHLTVNLVPTLGYIGLSYFKPNGEWDLTETGVSYYLLNPEGLDETTNGLIPVVEYAMHLRRKPAFYMLSIISPTLIMSLMSIMVFALPADSGEKISLSISVLLSYSVLLLLVSDMMPKNGQGLPLLG